MSVIRFAVRRFSFTLGALKWGQFSGLLYVLLKFFNFSSYIPLVNTEFIILANFSLAGVLSFSSKRIIFSLFIIDLFS